jgi:hypothetical protein
MSDGGDDVANATYAVLSTAVPSITWNVYPALEHYKVKAEGVLRILSAYPNIPTVQLGRKENPSCINFE